MMPNQISIWFIQEQCFGVYTIRILWSSRWRNSTRLSRLFNIPDFPLQPRSSSRPHCCATNRTRLSDLCVFRPSHTNVHDASGSVSTNARMAYTKSSSVRVWFRYGDSIRPVATSKKPIRLVVPWRMHPNSIRCRFPGDYRLVRVFVLQCLDSGHLIYGYGMAACRTYRFRLMVDGADLIHFFRKSLRRICFLGEMKPIADEMGADLPHILKNGLPFWQIWYPQSLPL